MVDFYGKCIGKYTRPMNGMGQGFKTCRLLRNAVKCHQGNNHRVPKQIAQEHRAPETISSKGLMQSQLLRFCVCVVLFVQVALTKSRTYKI